MNAKHRIRAVTLDVGGTLIEPWPSVGHVYARVAERFGIVCSAEGVNRSFAAAWRARVSLRKLCFPSSPPPGRNYSLWIEKQWQQPAIPRGLIS